jgi:hypothetical protein
VEIHNNEMSHNGDTLVEETNANTAIAAAATNAVNKDERFVITEFTGDYMNPVKRTITKPDPNRVGATLRTTKVLEGPVGLAMQYVVGKGKFENTEEPYISVQGQYAPGKTCRVTFSAQNAKKVSELLKGNVDVSSGIDPRNGQIKWPIKRQFLVDVFGTKMRGYALLAEELYVHEGDTVKAIIGAPIPDAQQAAELELL